MATIRPVIHAPRAVNSEPVENEYTDLVQELQDLEEQRRAMDEKDRPKRQEAVVEQDELPDGTEVKDVRKAISATARTHGIIVNFKSGKDEWPIVFGVTIPRETDETAEPTGNAAPTSKAA